MDVVRAVAAWFLVRLDALAAIVGLACIVWGVALLSVAVAFITAGVGLIAFALLPARRSA